VASGRRWPAGSRALPAGRRRPLAKRKEEIGSVPKFWSILFGVVLAASALLFVVAPFADWWLPENVCSYGPSVDNLFYLILAITGVAFIGTEAVLVWAMWKYTAKPGVKSTYTHGNHRLELIWTAVPAVILLFIAFAQVKAWEHIKYQSRMPDPDQVFEVSARQFEWRFRYPTAKQQATMTRAWAASGPKAGEDWEKKPHFDDIHVVNEVHIWKDGKVRMYLKTRDVLHSFFLPNLRIKQDALPGKTIPVWFDADRENGRWNDEEKKWERGHYDTRGKWIVDGKEVDWELACAELCGWGHYKMRGRLFVHPSKDDYNKWLAWAAAEQNKGREKEP
jgi:cytochrome c oxidase subunit 2